MNTEARKRILSYLLGEVSLAELEEWLTDETWDVEAATADTDIALDALLLVAEHARGDRTDEDLEVTLGQLLARIGEAPAFATTTNAVTERSTGWTQPQIAAVGTRFAGGPE